MNTFWTLVGFEYRKIFKKKSVILALVLAIVISVVSIFGTLFGCYYIDGEPFESNYDGMVKDRKYARELSGRAIDADLLMEAAAAYAAIPEDAKVYFSTDAYQKNARPYSEIYGIAQRIYNTSTNHFGAKNMGTLTHEQAEQFYNLRNQRIEKEVRATLMSDTAKTTVLERAAQIQTPFTFSYTDGYARFFTILHTSGLIAAFVMAICVAPVFAGEYTSGADQLLLCSKHGKGKLITAKLFTGFSLAGALSLLLIVQTYFQCMLTFGFDGGSTPIQVYLPLCVYPFTMAQVALLQSVCVLFACVLTAAVTMLLSAKCKSPFGVIILVTLLLVVPMMIHISDTSLLPYLLHNLLPSQMIPLWGVTDMIQYELFGLVIPSYVMLPVFAAVCSMVLTPFAFRAFKRHQIS